MNKIKAFFHNVKEAFKSGDRGTIFRTVLLILSYINQIVAFIGRTSFANAVWYQWVSLGLTFVTSAITWWYNNDWTSAARWGSRVMDALKDGKIDVEEVKDLLNVEDDE